VTRADAIILGGGPAGSSAAITLAQAGRRVVLVEKAAFPRYRVGESLIPYSFDTLQRLGVLEAVRAAGFQTKKSVRFVTAAGQMSRPFFFTERMEGPRATTWQVDRGRFDGLLLDRARSVGVQVILLPFD